MSRRVVSLVLTAAFLVAVTGCGDDDGEQITSSCSAIRLKDSTTGVDPSASTRAGDIAAAIEATQQNPSGEMPPSAEGWDLVAIGPLGVAPGECDSAVVSDDANVLDVTFRGDESDDALWVVLVTTSVDLDPIDRVALNGRLIELEK